eukprot:14304-Eustigmatos_ZCMA.PRE.1
MFSGWGRGGNDSSNYPNDDNTHAAQKITAVNDPRNVHIESATRYIDDDYTRPDRGASKHFDLHICLFCVYTLFMCLCGTARVVGEHTLTLIM